MVSSSSVGLFHLVARSLLSRQAAVQGFRLTLRILRILNLVGTVHVWQTASLQVQNTHSVIKRSGYSIQGGMIKEVEEQDKGIRLPIDGRMQNDRHLSSCIKIKRFI